MYRKTENAPSSMAEAPIQVRWSQIREISLMSTRMYWQRSGTSSPISFSTPAANAKLLISGET